LADIAIPPILMADLHQQWRGKMACDLCREIGTTLHVRLPADLSRVIAMAKDATQKGIIVEVDDRSTWQSGPFSGVSAEGPWDDIVSHSFRCTACAQFFRLSAETYHGGGGEWTREQG
jgi:hypothetical protein